MTAMAMLVALPGIFAQGKYFTRNAHVWFFSSAPMENIEAHNHQASSVIDTKTGEMAFSVLVKGFQFEKALMQEHFNEKYLESDKFPKSLFTGKITNLKDVNFDKPGTYNVTVEGKITIHGISKPIKTDGTIDVSKGQLEAKAKFPVTLADFDISIPSVVKDNIAKVVDVSVDAVYKPFNQ